MTTRTALMSTSEPLAAPAPASGTSLPAKSEDEAAAFLSLSVRTLQRFRVDGGGPPYVKLTGRRVAYLTEDLIAWLHARRRRNTADVVGLHAQDAA